jgi:formylglycine-generating enzyme required for sulfatase activity
VNISWYDAMLFCTWFNCRLLTEAEWEYVCTKNENSFWCCSENELNKYAWYSENSSGEIHNVAELLPNKYGLYDMHGNIWEWVFDCYDEKYYTKSIKNNPRCSFDIPFRSCRGGSIHAFSEMCRTSFRYYEPADYSAPDLGFRIAKSIKL